jgi:proton-dependent oligopeptide transporter, POT family
MTRNARMVERHATQRSAGGDLLGHPRGLLFIGGTELWERISFHGMQALLVLYMVEELLLPGHIERIAGFTELRELIQYVTGPLSSQAMASQIFGLYVGLVYLLPVVGGLLGDRVIGRRSAVILGGLLMASGHFCMTFDRSFLIALLLLIVGTAILRGNLTSQVGDLYSPSDNRRETAYQVYYALINLGAFVAPLITGSLAKEYGWHYGFAFAGFGMLIGVVIYISGGNVIPQQNAPRKRKEKYRLSATERRVIMMLTLLLPALSLFWIAQTQIWNTYNLWVRDHVDLSIHGWTMPVPWLQAVDALSVVVLVYPLLRFWRWQASHGWEPRDITKMGIGCITFGCAIAWLASAQFATGPLGKVPLPWAVAYHFISGVGYLYFAPVVIGVFSRAAPASANAMMIGVYYLSMFAGSVISGRLGGLYETLSPAQFWSIHSAVAIVGGMLFLALSERLSKALFPPLANGLFVASASGNSK